MGSKCSSFFFSPFKQRQRLFQFLKPFSLFPIPNLQRGKTLTMPHSAQRSVEPFCTAAFHRPQTWARNGYALLLNTRKWNKKSVKFLMSWRMEIAPPLQATCSSALPYALWKSMSHTVICHHCSSFHCATLRSVWHYLLRNSLKVANHKLDPFLSPLLQVVPP